MPRVYLQYVPQDQKTFTIEGEPARYLRHVLRVSAGDELTIFGPDANPGRAVVLSSGKSGVKVEIIELLPPLPEPQCEVYLLQGVLKGRKMDLVVQKAVELGVSCIVPLVTVRSQVRQTRKRERWQKIAAEAARQCGRAVVPQVVEPVGYKEYFNNKEGLNGYIFCEDGGGALSPQEMPGTGESLYLAVGPEGGFTPGEVSLARHAGLRAATLGRRVLRAETAAISALSIVQYLLGELGPGKSA